MKRMLLLLVLAIAPIILCVPGCDTSPTGLDGTDAPQSLIKPNSGTSSIPTTVGKGSDSGAHMKISIPPQPGHGDPIQTGPISGFTLAPHTLATIFQPSQGVDVPGIRWDIAIQIDSSAWILKVMPDGKMPTQWEATIDVCHNRPSCETAVPIPTWTGTWKDSAAHRALNLTSPNLPADSAAYYRVVIRFADENGIPVSMIRWFEYKFES